MMQTKYDSRVIKQKPPRRARRTLVCLLCKNKKLKCDKTRPSCKRCLEAQKLCVYESDNLPPQEDIKRTRKNNAVVRDPIRSSMINNEIRDKSSISFMTTQDNNNNTNGFSPINTTGSLNTARVASPATTNSTPNDSNINMNNNGNTPITLQSLDSQMKSQYLPKENDAIVSQPLITPNSSIPSGLGTDVGSDMYSMRNKMWPENTNQHNTNSSSSNNGSYNPTASTDPTTISPRDNLSPPKGSSTNLIQTPSDLKMRPERITSVPNVMMDLWNPRDMLVSYGSTTYYDLPYNTHSIAQSDPYLRALCACLHGDTITELRSRLTSISTNTPKGLSRNINVTMSNTTPQSDTSILLDTNHHKLNDVGSVDGTERKLHPLKFIEKAIVKWIENSNEQVTNQLPLDYFNTTFTVDDIMDPKLLSSLQTLVREIELILMDKNVIDSLLRKFYEEIYPFYPLFDIRSFETDLIYILMNSNGKRYEFNVYQSNIRKKLETLVLFLLILAITLRSPNLDDKLYNIPKDNADDTARQLLIYAQKLLSLLNGFKFTNEYIICSLLYLFIAAVINPEDRDVDVTHDKILTLNCIENLALTIGLFNDPSYYPRYEKEPTKNEAFHVFRRKLWIGLQSLKLEYLTSNGSGNILNIQYLNTFLGSTPDLISNLSSKLETSSEVDRKIFSIQEDKYHFHILLSKLMSSSVSVGEQQNLQVILDNIKVTLDFMHQRFPLSKLNKKGDTKNIIVEPSWRGARVDLTSVEALEIFNANLIGLSSVMSIYNKLIFHFERESINSSEKYDKYYHKFFLEAINLYLQLTKLVTDYLRDKFDHVIMSSQKYSINKYVVYTLVRLWLVEMSYAARFSYKKEILKQQRLANANDFFNEQSEEDIQLNTILVFNLSHIKQQMETIVNLAADKLQEPYIGCYQATLMVRYLLYVMNNAGLADVINNFWERAFNTTEIPEYVLQKLNMKWGLSTKGTDFVSKYLMNPESLQNLNLPLLKQIQYMFDETDFYSHPSSENLELDNSPPGFDNEEMLNQFLESNFDLFLGVINDNLGELPSL